MIVDNHVLTLALRWNGNWEREMSNVKRDA